MIKSHLIGVLLTKLGFAKIAVGYRAISVVPLPGRCHPNAVVRVVEVRRRRRVCGRGRHKAGVDVPKQIALIDTCAICAIGRLVQPEPSIAGLAQRGAQAHLVRGVERCEPPIVGVAASRPGRVPICTGAAIEKAPLLRPGEL